MGEDLVRLLIQLRTPGRIGDDTRLIHQRIKLGIAVVDALARAVGAVEVVVDLEVRIGVERVPRDDGEGQRAAGALGVPRCIVHHVKDEVDARLRQIALHGLGNRGLALADLAAADGHAVRVARLGEQRLCGVDAVLIHAVGGIVAGDGRVEVGASRDARAVEHVLHELLAVDGRGDRLAHVDVGERLAVQVQAQEAGAQRMIAGDLVRERILILAEHRSGQVAHVDVVILVGEQLGRGIRVEPDLDLVQVDLAAVVVRVLDQHADGVRVVALDHVRAGAHEVAVHTPARAGCRAGILGEDVRIAGAQVLDERRVGVLQRDGEMVIVDDLKAGQLGGLAREHRLRAHDHVEVAVALGARGRREHPLEGEFHVAGMQLGAVGEIHALLELEAVDRAILADGREIRQQHDLLVVVIVKAQQALGDLVRNGGREAAGGNLHVQRVAVGRLTKAQHLFLRAGRRRHERQRRKQNQNSPEKLHVFPSFRLHPNRRGVHRHPLPALHPGAVLSFFGMTQFYTN